MARYHQWCQPIYQCLKKIEYINIYNLKNYYYIGFLMPFQFTKSINNSTKYSTNYNIVYII